MSTEIRNTDDVIDSRDIIERIEELETEAQEAYESYPPDDATDDTWDEMESDERATYLGEDEAEEYRQLNALVEDIRNSSGDNPEDGATLIRDSYFEDYARQLADDIGAIDADAGWPTCHIDWEAAAESLQQDYSAVEYGDTTYWVR